MKVAVIIPAYNEETTIGKVIQEVQEYCTFIVVVDDGSTDNTYGRVMETGACVLRHPINRGQGAALETGKRWALRNGAEIIVHFDADGQHSAEDIAVLIGPVVSGQTDVALGSRLKKRKEETESPLKKVIIRKLAVLHQWFFTGLEITDSQCGLRAMNKYAAEMIEIKQRRMSHSSEILEHIARKHLRYMEVPVTVRDTQYSLQKGQKNIIGSIRILYDYFIGRLL